MPNSKGRIERASHRAGLLARGDRRRSALPSLGLTDPNPTLSIRKSKRRPVNDITQLPIQIVAVSHDTSIEVLEQTYSRHIGDHSASLARVALRELSAVSLAGRAQGRALQVQKQPSRLRSRLGRRQNKW